MLLKIIFFGESREFRGYTHAQDERQKNREQKRDEKEKENQLTAHVVVPVTTSHTWIRLAQSPVTNRPKKYLTKVNDIE